MKPVSYDTCIESKLDMVGKSTCELRVFFCSRKELFGNSIHSGKFKEWSFRVFFVEKNSITRIIDRFLLLSYNLIEMHVLFDQYLKFSVRQFKSLRTAITGLPPSTSKIRIIFV